MIDFSIIISLIVIAVVILFVVRLWLNKIENNTQMSNELVEWMKDLGKRVETSTQTVDMKLSRNMEIFNSRLDQASSVIANVQRSIGEFSEIGRSMQDLQQFLASPKLRGNIGEQILKEMLGQYFPQGTYALQHAFLNGEKVDAIIRVSHGIIPIDSKFPIDNFRKLMSAETADERERIRRDFERDVRKHIQDIAKKYICVNEGTVDYALMYIPSEAVYYEIINNAALYDFASTNRILLVSPMSFYAYVKAILMSFEGQKIQSQAKEILKTLTAIKKDYEKTEESVAILNKHITNAYNQGAQVNKNLTTLGQKLESTHLIPSAEQEKLLE